MTDRLPPVSPAISVIIPVYDTGLWTLDALDSVLTQTLPPAEILLVDDGSAAPTAQLLDRAAADHPTLVRLLRHPRNRGLAAARNTGIEAARGDVLILLDSDDVLADSQVLEDVARSHAQTGWDMLRLRLEFWKQDPVSGAETRWPDPCDQFIPADLTGVTTAQVPALFQSRANWQFAYRREFLAEQGLRFDEELRRREDRPFLNHALLKAARIDLSGRFGFLYRQRPDSIMHDPKLEDLALFARGVEIARGRIDDAGEALGPARFILEIHYLTGLHGLTAPFLKAGEEDAVRAMLTRFRSATMRDLPPEHPGAGPEAAAGFAEWPARSRQSVFPPSPARELASGWLAALHAALLEGVEPALELLWAAQAAPRDALASGAMSASIAASKARAEAMGPPAAPSLAPRARAGGAKPKLLLHVGLTKTGSTSLQNFFEMNRARLLDRGCIYPETGIFREAGTDRGSGHNMAVREVFRNGKRKVWDAMLEEIADSGADRALLSCENLSWNADWRSPAGVAALARALEGFEVHPLMVVRDEFDWLTSMYKEAVAGGWLRWRDDPAEFFRMQEALGGTDFEAIMAGFAAGFGAQNCRIIDVKGEGELARRALADFAPDLAADEGLLSPPRANIGTPDAAAPALRLLNRLPAEGAVERAFFAEARERGLDVQDPEPRIAAMLDGVAARRAEAGRPEWSAEERAAKAERLRALWGSADVNLAAELVTERVRWARRPAEAPAAPVTRIAAAPETPRPLPGVERMLDHDQGEEARRIRRFGAPRPYGFSAECDVDAGLARIEAAAPLGEVRLVWDVLDDPDSVEEGDWTALPEDACAAVIPIPRRRFAAHARLKIFARAGARTWRREICLALQEGAPFALVIGGAGPAGGPRAVETRGARGPRGLAASR